VNPDRRAQSATTSVPAAGRSVPSSASSPHSIMPSSGCHGMTSWLASRAHATARSMPGLSLRSSAGARFTTCLRGWILWPQWPSALLTRSRASTSAPLMRPTIVNAGSPSPTSASTVTTVASTPAMHAA
jgi:hypothetical protein